MRIKPLVVLSLVCSLSQAADTVASLGDSIKATQFVTAVDHSKLINGTSKLRLSQDGVVSVGTDQSPFGNPVITIHAGSVFSADTAAHGKTFSTDLVLDYTYIDGVSGPLLIRTNGWVFVAPAGGSTFWCGPQDWPSYAFDLNNYDSESSTATLSSTDSDPSCSFSGTITITRSRGKTIPTIDHVLPGETIFKGSYNEFETKGFVNYAFKGPYPYDTTMLTLNMADIEFFGSSVGIMNPTYGGADGSYMWGIGQFWKNGYHYSLPYTDNNGSGDYTLATTSMLNGLASTTWVNSKKWDWSTQITNKPTNVSAFNNDVGYVTSNHTHSNLVNGTTEVVANNDGTASIVSTTEVYGFKVSARTRDQSRAEGNQPILIEMEIPVPLAMFDDAMFRTVQSIRLRICEPLTGGSPREIVPWQTVALDHTKFGGPEGQYFGIADNAITQVNSEWFTTINPGYNWINDIYNAPFRINYANAAVSSLYTAWGPIGSTSEDILTTDLVGKKRQIATIDQIQPIAESIARQIIRDAVSNVSTNIQSAEDARVSLTNLITILKNL